MNEQDEQRARDFLADPEMGFPLCTGMGRFPPGEPYKFHVDKLTAAFRAVREECARVADGFMRQNTGKDGVNHNYRGRVAMNTAKNIAAAIRATNQEGA